MRCKYPERDLVQRLDHTICRYNGKAFYVRVNGNLLNLQDVVGTKTVHTIVPDDPNFDISTPALGFFQANSNIVCYVNRRPIRAWKQGICMDNLSFNFISNDGKKTGGIEGLRSKAFEDMINGDYPDINRTLRALSEITDVHKEVAVSRDIALKWNYKMQFTYVYYKMEQVGFILKNTHKVIVPNNEFGWIISQNLSGFGWEIE